MRNLIAVIAILFAGVTHAQEWEDRSVFAGTNTDQKLRILSSTDTSFFEPIIKRFLSLNPTIEIEYLVTSTASLDDVFRDDPNAFDIVISSAMDLQLKLVNDGYASKIEGIPHPNWATWRESLFAFTIEPAAIVINKAAFKGENIPKTRQDLIQSLRARPNFFRNKLGTYDVRQSGLGYLFATQDARASETYWRLMEVMGSLGTKLYCCSGAMIDDLEKGDIAVAYNVLSSYANARKNRNGKIEVILPANFPTTMMRTAIVSKTTSNPRNAESFVRHLLEIQLENPNDAAPSLPTLLLKPGGQTIALEPALMTYLDKLKRRTFITEWERAIVQ
jgi:iron(III) transport system substrate-binding protein